MHKHLGLIAAIGFVAAAIFLGGAWLLSGGAGLGDLALRIATSRLPRCGEAPTGQTASREITWTDGDTVAVSLPADLTYRPGSDDAMMKVTGDAALIPHIVVEQGEIKLNCLPGRLRTGRVAITLPGRSFLRFNLAGATSANLRDIDQPELRFNLAGSSSVAAAGKVESLRINGAGSSEAKLGQLSVQDAHLNLVGQSNVEVAVADSIELNSVGAATLTLLGEPKSLKTNIVGASRIIHRAL